MAALIRSGKSEEGSALILALFCIVILTLIGIALSVVTSGEMGIAGNEAQVTRTFYSAESGITVGTAWAFTNGTNLLSFENMAETGVIALGSPFTALNTTNTLVRTTTNVAGQPGDPYNPNQMTINVTLPAPMKLAYSPAKDFGLSENYFSVLYRLQSTALDQLQVSGGPNPPPPNPPSHSITQNITAIVKAHI